MAEPDGSGDGDIIFPLPGTEGSGEGSVALPPDTGAVPSGGFSEPPASGGAPGDVPSGALPPAYVPSQPAPVEVPAVTVTQPDPVKAPPPAVVVAPPAQPTPPAAVGAPDPVTAPVEGSVQEEVTVPDTTPSDSLPSGGATGGGAPATKPLPDSSVPSNETGGEGQPDRQPTATLPQGDDQAQPDQQQTTAGQQGSQGSSADQQGRGDHNDQDNEETRSPQDGRGGDGQGQGSPGGGGNGQNGGPRPGQGNGNGGGHHDDDDDDGHGGPRPGDDDDHHQPGDNQPPKHIPRPQPKPIPHEYPHDNSHGGYRPPPVSDWRPPKVDLSLSIKWEVNIHLTDQGYVWVNTSTEVKFIAIYKDGGLEPCDMIRVEPGHSRRVDDFRGLNQNDNFIWFAGSAYAGRDEYDIQGAGGFRLGGLEVSGSLRVRFDSRYDAIPCDDFVVYEDKGYARVNVQNIVTNNIETVYVYGRYDENREWVANNTHAFSSYPNPVPEQRSSKVPSVIMGGGNTADGSEKPAANEKWDAAAFKSMASNPWALSGTALLLIGVLVNRLTSRRSPKVAEQPEDPVSVSGA